MAVEKPSQVAGDRVPSIRGLAKLHFRLFINLAKTLTVQVRG
jgi:hypothetical protein